MTQHGNSPSILERLKNYSQYLHEFHHSQQPAVFEYLVAEAFSHILHLPFYTSDTNDSAVHHRVVWRGSVKGQHYSRSGWGPDAIAYAYGYSLLIQPTLKEDAGQWTGEFAPCCKHYDQFTCGKGLDPTSVYLIMVAPSFHQDTWRSVAQSRRISFVLMEVADCVSVLDTSILALTMTHLQLRLLLGALAKSSQTSTSLDEFRAQVQSRVAEWQMDTLRAAKTAFLGVKSYEAMRRIGRKHVSSGEIFGELHRDPTALHYMRVLGRRLGSEDIEDSLVKENLGVRLATLPHGNEELFCPVSLTDYANRAKRLVQAVEEIDARFP